MLVECMFFTVFLLYTTANLRNKPWWWWL